MEKEHKHEWYIVKNIEFLSTDEVFNLKQQENPLKYCQKEIVVLCTVCGKVSLLNDLK